VDQLVLAHLLARIDTGAAVRSNLGDMQKARAILGLMAVAAFAIIYGVELLPHGGPPATVRWLRGALGTKGLIAVNIAIVLAFFALLPYRRSTKAEWRSKGIFAAFVIALMTEMFGWPLMLFLISPLVDVPQIAPAFFRKVGHWPASLGTLLSLIGLLLLVIGWKQIHDARGLVTECLYRYVRHPQYTGMMLFTFGWIIHWPSVVTLALWPALVGAYVWLAMQEEKEALREFGADYDQYARRTKRFIPGLI
jgi:hypothetical protein